MLVIPSQIIIYHCTRRSSILASEHLSGLIFAYAAFGLPISTYLLAAYFRSIPDELLEAARLDGAGESASSFLFCYPFQRQQSRSVYPELVWMWNDLLLLCHLGRIGQEDAHGWRGAAFGQYDVSIPLISAGLVVASCRHGRLLVFPALSCQALFRAVR